MHWALLLILVEFVPSLIWAGPGGGAGAAPSFDQQIQAPVLEPSKRGSIAGELSSFSQSGTDLMKGGVSVALPFDFPSDRGKLLYSFVPKYSITQGVSEWGMGFESHLSISRFRRQGSLNYKDDQFVSPWGALVQGNDSSYYPEGLQTHVRLRYVEEKDCWIVFLENGDRLTFGGDQARIKTGNGTYAWYLISIESVTAEKTIYTYVVPETTPERFGSKRSIKETPILDAIYYGGTSGQFQYEIKFGSSILTKPIFHYRSGERVTLRRRIDKVSLNVRQGSNYKERFSYQLTYRKSGNGVGFYLVEVAQNYPSGWKKPPFSLDYNYPEKLLTKKAWMPVPEFGEVLRKFSNALVPERHSVMSLEEDGRIQVEMANSYSRFSSLNGLFELFSLPPRDSGIDPYCRINIEDSVPSPRFHARLRGKATALQVIGFEVRTKSSSPFVETTLHICDLEGHLQQTTVIPGYDLRPGTYEKLVDLTNKGRPDLVWIGEGNGRDTDNLLGSEIRFKIFENISTDTEIKFREPIEVKVYGLLSRGTTVALFQDINGDGILDFVLIQTSGISVWYGKGGFEFEKDHVFIPFWVMKGFSTSNLFKDRVSFHDLTGDGLPDAVVQTDTGASIFLNQGNEFVYQSDSPLSGRTWGLSAGRPVVLDLLGTGNVQIVAQDLMQNKTNVIEISEPGTGFLRQVDDGKGNIVEFTYRRVESSPGIQHRFPVIESTKLSVSGEGSRLEEYTFRSPVLHSQDKGFLGFGTISKKSEVANSNFTFQYADHQPGVMIQSEDRDTRLTSIVRFVNQGYEQVSSTLLGFEWLRLSTVEEGYKEAPTDSHSTYSYGAKTASKNTQIFYPDRSICPDRINTRDAHGALIYEMKAFDAPLFKDSLACLLDTFSVNGSHSKKDLDFKEGLHVQRNEFGQVIEVSRLSAFNPKVSQSVAYNAEHQVKTITVPGFGTTTFDYNPETTLLSSLMKPDGVKVIASRDLVHDQIISLEEDRGDGSSYFQIFEFDLLERLKRAFAKLGSDSRPHSELEYKYIYASSFTPGLIESTKVLGDFTRPVVQREAVLFSGSGAELGVLADLSTNGVIFGIKSKELSLNKFKEFASHTVDFKRLLDAPNYNDIYTADLPPLVEKSESVFDLEIDVTQIHQAGVQGEKASSYKLESDQLIQSTVENKNSYLNWVNGKDHQGKMQFYQTPEGKIYTYKYDALARLTEVVLPSGDKHQIQFNDLGEIKKIIRTGLGSIQFEYNPENSLLAKKVYFNEKGAPARSVEWNYDHQGRKTQVVFRDVLSGAAETYRYKYDGDRVGDPRLPGQNGRLTQVIGPAYQKSWIYREDGKVTEESTRFEGFSTLITRYEYRSDGGVQFRKIQRLDASGKAIVDLALQYELDTVGRESKVILNNSLLYELKYDSLSRVASVDGIPFSLGFVFDAQTQKEKGWTQKYSDSSSSYEMNWNTGPRGLIENEKFKTTDQLVSHSYGYTDSGFLASFKSDKNSVSYAYDNGDQLSQAGVQTIKANANQWQIQQGPTEQGAYTLDALGRVSKKELPGDRLQILYGPQGRVSHLVQFPKTAVEFSYDDDGIRILKRRGGRIEEAYQGQIVLTPDALLIPIGLNGKTIAYLEDAKVKPLSPDLRNSIVSSDGKSLDVPEPFGERGNRDSDPSHSKLIDYALLGYDRDLKAYRAEHRDYDPVVKRFLSPDPLFLESPEKCVESPFECNLYSYAQNNPVSFVDPTGLYTEPNKALNSSSQIVIDGFISQSTVGPPVPGMQFQGDGRVFGPHATTPDQSRLTVWIDPQSQTAMHHVSDSHRAGSSQGYAPDPNNMINVNFGNGIITVDINAKNSAVPFPANLGTPAIGNHFTFINSEGGWHGTMTGNAFPSWEVNNWNNGFAMPMMESMEKPGPISGPFHLFDFTPSRTVNF